MTFNNINKKFLTWLVLSIIFFSGYTGKVFAQTIYTDSVDHYSLTLPNGWKEIPIDIIEQFTAEVASQTGRQQIKYDAGFQLTEREYFQYPYVLLQEYKINSPSYSEIEKTLNSDDLNKGFDKTAKEYSEFIQNSSFNKPFIDKKRGIIFMSVNMDG